MTGTVVEKLSQALAAEEPVFCAWVGMNEPAAAEALAREAFDAVILDMQHGAFDFAGASGGIAAAALAGRPSIVRIPVGEFATASRVLDAGAAGVIAPMINSRAEAEAFAAFAKFTPVGERSWGPRAALPLSGHDPQDYLAAANRLTVAIAMIETGAALAALDDILGVAGVDGLFLGPSDLSVALSKGARLDPRGPAVMEASERVVERARAHGKFAAMFCFDGADARAMAALGFRLLSISTDSGLMRAAARRELLAARGGAPAGAGAADKNY